MTQKRTNFQIDVDIKTISTMELTERQHNHVKD